MKTIAPGAPYYGECTSSDPATGSPRDADALPVAVATRGNADDAGFALTVAKLATGRYSVSGTVPAGYTAGEQVYISVAAAVAGIARAAVIDQVFVTATQRRPGTPYYGQFVTAHPVTGAVQDADALPTAAATHNGAADVAFALTVAKLATGRYAVWGTVPAGYAAGDGVEITAGATVGGAAFSAVIDGFDVDESSPAVVSAPVVTGDEDTDGLLAIKSAFIRLQFEAAQNPNPSYSIHGHQYSLTEYQQFLVNSIAALNRLLQAQDPYMLHSVAST